MKREVFVSVDVEADGPVPGLYSMLSVGAVLVDDPEESFYRELKPVTDRVDRKALRVSGLDRDKLAREGAEPEDALAEMEEWLAKACGPNGEPVLVAFNAPFDWMFLRWYFERYRGSWPFGVYGLDVKAYYMGLFRREKWRDARRHRIPKRFRPEDEVAHHALADARAQAELFRRLREHAAEV